MGNPSVYKWKASTGNLCLFLKVNLKDSEKFTLGTIKTFPLQVFFFFNTTLNILIVFLNLVKYIFSSNYLHCKIDNF